MILLPGSLAYDLIAIFTTLLAGLILFYKYRFGYWKRVGLDYLEPSIPFGNVKKLVFQQLSLGGQFAEFYWEFKKRGLKHGGIYLFGRPFYVPVDPDIIKNMLIKDFQHFVDRGFYVNEIDDPLSGHLFSLEGTKWRNLRASLTATFTSGKMKMMFETITAVANQLENVVTKLETKNEPIDIKEILARFSTDVISSCAFGLDSNSLTVPDTDFRRIGRRMIENTAWENIHGLIAFSLPFPFLRFIKFKATKIDIEEFILGIVKKTVEYREKNNVYRKDFLHLLLQLKNRGKLSDDNKIIDTNDTGNGIINLNELSAQVFVFFVAGFETSSTTMTFALYELCKNQSIQTKLRQEIQEVLEKHDGKLSYDAIAEMTYLDKVISETMRKHPALPQLNRMCTSSYKIPGTDVTLDKGVNVVIPIIAMHYDPDFFPNPDKFDPERFNEENKKTRPSTAYMPFGEGPRNCIGLRFGLMQTKIGLITLLNKFKIKLNKKTIEPLVYDKTTFTLATENEIFLDVTKL